MNNQNKIKMSDNELAEVRLLQEKFQQKVFQLGQLSLQKMDVDEKVKSINEQEVKLKAEWNNIKKMEDELINKLLSKYGEGSLDLQEGTFISEGKPAQPS